MANSAFTFRSLVTAVNSKTGSVTLVKGDIGLGNVDNTSDANKPVSTAQQTALDAKAALTSIISSLGASFDGAGVAVASGSTQYVVAPYTGTISRWIITADTGTCTIKFWKKAAGTTRPTVADSISTSGVSLSTGTMIRSSTTSDFTTTAVTAGDIIAINVDTVSGATNITAQLEITRTV